MCEFLVWSVGDVIRGIGSHNKDIIREIVETRDTGYTWKYPNSNQTFQSENSTDPFLQFGWKRFRIKEEFEEDFRGEMPKSEYDEFMITLPCNCPDPLCPGWAAVVNEPKYIEMHNTLFNP